MSRELKEIYNKGRHYGRIKERYSSWRGGVISRINKMYRTNHKNLSDEKIMSYIHDSEEYEKKWRVVK